MALFGEKQEIGYHRKQTVDEDLARDENGIVLQIGRNHQHGVETPAEGSPKGQRVAKGREMEHEMAIEYDNDHAQGCHQRPQRLDTRQSQRTKEERYQEGGHKGRETDDERGIGGRGVVHRRVLRQEIECTTCNAQSEHQHLVLPAFGKQLERLSPTLLHGERIGEQEHIGDDEAKREDLRRRQTSQKQHLRRDEGAAPDGYHDECDEVVFEAGA